MPSFKYKPYYGWVVVASFLVIGGVMHGINQSFGVFFKSIENEFGVTRAATSAVVSVQNVFGSAISIVAGWSLDRFGPRIITLFMGFFVGLSLLLTSQTLALWQLFITYSLLFCVIGAVYTTTVGTVSRWFDKNRGLALGISCAGIGLGTLAIAPFATYLIVSFNWRTAYIVLGIIAWVFIIPLSRLLRRNPGEMGVDPGGVKSGSETGRAKPEKGRRTQLIGFSFKEASRTRSFWLFVPISLLTAFCNFLVIIHIVPHATDIGIPAIEAATVMGVIGASNTAGRMLIGRVSDIIDRRKTAVVCALLVAAAMLWLIWSKELLMFYAFGVVFGFSVGGLDTTMTALVGDTFGMRNIGIIMGALQVNWGIGMIIGPAVGGLVFDVANSYFIAFLMGVLAMVAIAMLIALTRREASQVSSDYA
jgi:OFA family oxalate/formate antiporter-like MFS transporter